jgi:hypothetical protein
MSRLLYKSCHTEKNWPNLFLVKKRQNILKNTPDDAHMDTDKDEQSRDRTVQASEEELAAI